MPGKKKTKKSRARSHGASRGNLSRSTRERSVSSKKASVSQNRRKGFNRGRRPYDYAAYEKEEATPEYMQRLFTAHAFKVSSRQLEQFWDYYRLLRKHNASLDLTRIMGIEATVLKHFIDSAMVLEMVKVDSPLLDIGTGPGFPGVPIAVMRPKMKVILAESRGKRVTFLEMVKKELALTNATIHAKSIREDSGVQVQSVITRALEVIPATLQRVKALVPAQGQVIFMKGPNCGKEITAAQQGFKGVYKMTQDAQYVLPNTGQKRRLVVFQRRGDDA